MFWDNFYRLCLLKETKPTPVVTELGIALGSITKWKNGATPNSETLQKIAQFFGVTIDSLIDDPSLNVNNEKLMDIYYHGTLAWLDNIFLDEDVRSRAKEHFSELLMKYKFFVNSLADFKTGSASEETISKYASDLRLWVSLLPEYVTESPLKSSEVDAEFKELFEVYKTIDISSRRRLFGQAYELLEEFKNKND